METARFDELTKTLATNASRRRVLRGLGAALAAALTGAVRDRDALAGPRPDGCNGAGGICQGKKSRPCCADSLCLSDGKCCHSVAVCDGINCYDLKNDPDNCGSCGNACGALPGVASAQCVAGVCTVTTCAAGFANCDGAASNGCETDLTSDPANCGACGNACVASAPAHTVVTGCTQGTCTYACAPGYHDCGGSCVDSTSPTSCGTSCEACPAPANGTATCDGAACGFACDAGFRPCGGACIAENACCTDAECRPNEICTGGTCSCGGASCAPGRVCGPAGTCQPGCFIDGAFWWKGQFNPAPGKGCRICTPELNAFAWSTAPAGHPCANNCGDSCDGVSAGCAFPGVPAGGVNVCTVSCYAFDGSGGPCTPPCMNCYSDYGSGGQMMPGYCVSGFCGGPFGKLLP